MAVTIDGTTGITTPSLTNTGAFSLVDLTTSGNTVIGDATTDTLVVGVNGIVKDTFGNVGIGTATPTAKLEISDSVNGQFKSAIRNSNAGSSAYAQFLLGNDTSASAATISLNSSTNTSLLGGANSLNIYQGLSAPIAFQTAAVERMRLDANGNMLIGLTSVLTVTGGNWNQQIAGTGPTGSVVARFSDNVNPARFIAVKSRGTSVGTNTIIQNGDEIGSLDFAAADGTSYTTAVRISGNIDGVPGTGDLPSRLTFATTNDGAAAPTERMRIDSAGNVGIGVTPSAWLSTVKAIQLSNRASIYTDSSGNTIIGNNSFVNSSSQDIYLQTAQASAYLQGTGQHKWYNAASGTAGNTITFTQAMTLDASGNLGVGTGANALAGKLEISAGTGAIAQRWSYTADPVNYNLRLYTVDNGASDVSWYFTHQTNGANTNVLSFKAGNVGIGNNVPVYKLDVGPVSSSQSATVGASGLIRNSAGADTSPFTQARIIVYGGTNVDTNNWGYLAYGSDATMRVVYGKTGSSTASLAFVTSSATDGTGSLSEKARFDPTGNLLIGYTTTTSQAANSLLVSGYAGVGTNAPSRQLEVYNAAAVYAKIKSATTAQAALEIINGGGAFYMGIDTSGGGAFGSGAYGRVLYSDGAYPMVFYTNSTERMRIDSGGNVLLGGTQVGQSALFTTYWTNGASAYNTQLFNSYASGTSYFIEFLKRVSTTNSTVGSITYNGTNTLYNTTSDIRLKKNIVDAPSALTLINDIKIRSFDWKDSDVHVDYGVVAQEIFEVAPSCVSDGDTEDEIQRTWGVDTSILVPTLIKAIQEQQALIVQLQADVVALKSLKS